MSTPAGTVAFSWTKTENLKEHPQKAVVPVMDDGQFKDLVESIRRDGIRVPLDVTKANVVLDGHSRLAAARALNLKEVPVRVVKYEGDEAKLMLTTNLARRHLTSEQRIALLAKVLEDRRASGRTKMSREERAYGKKGARWER